MKKVYELGKIAKVVFALSALITAVSSYGRTLSVVSIDRDADGWTRSAQFGLSTGETEYLYLAHGATDGGSDIGSWDNVTKIAAIHPLATSFTYAFTNTSVNASRYIRFFLLDQDADASVARCEYHSFNTWQHLDTGTILTGHETIEVSMSLDNVTSTRCVFNARETPGRNNMTVFYLKDAGWRYDYNRSSTTTNHPTSANTRYSVVAADTGLYIDGDRIVETIPATIDTVNPLLVFTVSNIDSSGTGMKGRLYAFRLWDGDGGLKFDLVPSMTNGVACFYEKVSGEYWGAAGAGSIAAGPAAAGTPAVMAQSDTITGCFGVSREIDVLSSAYTGSRLSSANIVVGPGPASWLYAAYGNSDGGDDIAAWDNWFEVGQILAEGTPSNIVFQTKGCWPRTTEYVRFFLFDADYCPGVERLKSVIANGGQYVQTGFRPNQDTVIEMEVKISDIGKSQALFCARGEWNAQDTVTLFYITGEGWRYDFNKTAQSSTVTAEAGTNYVIRTGMYQLDVGETQVFPSASSSAFEAGGNLAFFATHANGASYGNRFYGELSYVRVWSNDVKCLDLVPCRKEGVVGLYDKVGKAFLPGTGGLQAGTPASNGTVIDTSTTLKAHKNLGFIVSFE